MPKTLLIPIHLDALIVNKSRTILEEMADFSQLPYPDRQAGKTLKFCNTAKAFLSGEILSHPIQEKSRNLSPGVHLHWSLPDTLTQAIKLKIIHRQDFLDTFIRTKGYGQERVENTWKVLIASPWLTEVNPDLAFVNGWDSANPPNWQVPGLDDKHFSDFIHQIPESNFPPLPNRWLVRRTYKGRKPDFWLIQSDCLKFIDQDERSKGRLLLDDDQTFVGVPYLRLPTETESRPFGYLGNRIPQDEKSCFGNLKKVLGNDEQLAGATYLNYIPAIGYGDPTFAAFYPNCHSVFGSYDPLEGKNGQLPDEYLVLGWYSNKNLDFFHQFFPEFNKINKDSKSLVQALKAALRWDYDSDEALKETDHLFCFASLNVKPDDLNQLDENDNKSAPVSIAVGNSNAEALSALLASQISKPVDGTERGNMQEELAQQLDALHVSSRLDSRQLDIGPKFQEFRHELSFSAQAAGTQWIIIPRMNPVLKSPLKSDNTPAPATGQWTLPDNIASLLNELNILQNQYDQKIFEMDALQRQIYSDWSKYMLSIYPPDGLPVPVDPDKIKFYIEEKGLKFLMGQPAVGKQAIAQKGLFELIFEGKDELERLKNGLEKILQTYNAQIETTATYSYALIVKGAPRYWEPNEPVLLINGDAVVPSSRHGQDGRLDPQGYLRCYLLDELPDGKTWPQRVDQALNAIDKNRNSTSEQIGYFTWDKQPWNPFLLEWEVELQTMQEGSNQLNSNETYDVNFVAKNYSFGPTANDLKQESLLSLKANDFYFGRSILTPAANNKLKYELGQFIMQRISPTELTAFYQDQSIAPENQQSKWVKEHVADLVAWFLAKHPQAYDPQQTKGYNSRQLLQRLHEVNVQYFQTSGSGLITTDQDVLSGLQAWITTRIGALDDFFASNEVATKDQATYIAQHQELLINWYIRKIHLLNYMVIYQLVSQLPILSQALSGFNHAMLMHRQSFQLPIADPIGFAEYRDFTEVAVKNAVGRATKVAPQPLNSFNPIRNGELSITSLRLVDTFGMIQDLDIQSLILSDLFPAGHNDQSFWLPPRIVQPARLNFRWLSAADGEAEMSDQPTTSPVCGWIVSNKLDHELMVYRHDGKMLGYLVAKNAEVIWLAASGGEGLDDNAKIENAALNRLISQIINNANKNIPSGSGRLKNPYLGQLLDNIDTAQENIEPEGFAQDQVRAVLMGRPIAVVRTSISLELKGPPAVHQGWEELEADMAKLSDFSERENNGFTQVKFPVRIGENRQFDDGLIGFWPEEKDAKGDLQLQPTFYSQQSVDNLQLSIAQPPQTLTLLFDPRGKLHATSGILPTKIIDIPPDQYNAAMSRIEVAFRAMPVITPQDQIRLPLPSEPGFAWSWLEEPTPGSWTEVSSIGIVRKNIFVQAFAKLDAGEVWAALIGARWLKSLISPLTDPEEERAQVVPTDQRPEVHERVFQGLETPIQQYLVSTKGTIPKAAFTTAYEAFPEVVNAPRDQKVSVDDCWVALLGAGWLQAVNDQEATVVPIAQRPAAYRKVWADLTQALQNQLQDYLDRSHIDPIITNAQFNTPLKISEGWLKLKKTKANE